MEKVKKGRGRPRIENPKNIDLHILLSEDEYAELGEMSINMNRSMAEIVREGLRMQRNLYRATR